MEAESCRSEGRSSGPPGYGAPPARGEAVSRDRLIDALWGERPPATAPHTLDAYVSRASEAGLGTGPLTAGAGRLRPCRSRPASSTSTASNSRQHGRSATRGGRAPRRRRALRSALTSGAAGARRCRLRAVRRQAARRSGRASAGSRRGSDRRRSASAGRTPSWSVSSRDWCASTRSVSVCSGS